MGLASDLMSFAGTLFPRLKRRADLRARWGLPGEGDAARAGRYFALTRKLTEATAVVDDKTWSDLEFATFFKTLDTTITPIGRQYLFNQLRTYDFDKDELKRRFRAYEVFGAEHQQRENIQLALKHLEMDSAAYIADLLLGPEPEKYRCSNWSSLACCSPSSPFRLRSPIWRQSGCAAFHSRSTCSSPGRST